MVFDTVKYVLDMSKGKSKIKRDQYMINELIPLPPGKEKWNQQRVF